MIKGLYSAASAMIANMVRQNTLAHNAANVDTPGFKQIMVTLDDYVDVPVIFPMGTSLPAGLLNSVGDLGLGVENSDEVTDFTYGSLKFTGQPLDVAIHGLGFFRVDTPEGIRYTRDGRFLRDPDGQLVTVDGYQVLDAADNPITIPDGLVAITEDGSIYVDGQLSGQIAIDSFEDPDAELLRDLPNTFEAAGPPTGTETGRVQQFYLEMANVNPALLMTQMVDVARAYEAAQQMVTVQDELLGRTISTLGRF